MGTYVFEKNLFINLPCSGLLSMANAQDWKIIIPMTSFVSICLFLRLLHAFDRIEQVAAGAVNFPQPWSGSRSLMRTFYAEPKPRVCIAPFLHRSSNQLGVEARFAQRCRG